MEYGNKNAVNYFKGEPVDKYFNIELIGKYDDAKKILTPGFVSYLLDLKKVFDGRHINFLYTAEYTIVVISLFAANAFEPKGLFHSFLDKSGINRIYHQIKACINFIEYIDNK